MTSTVQSPAVMQVGGKIHCTVEEVMERTEENIDAFLLFLTNVVFTKLITSALNLIMLLPACVRSSSLTVVESTLTIALNNV